MPPTAPDARESRRRRASGLLAWLSLLAGVLACAACSERGSAAGERQEHAASVDRGATPERPGAQELTIFAAASLRNAFEALAEDFRRAHPAVELRFSFAGSQELRVQIEHGAPADVFASADAGHMDALVAQGLARPAARFARNHLVIVVPEGVATVKELPDLPRARRIVIGGADVPVGRYTRAMLARAAVRWPGFDQAVLARVVSQELNVRQVLAKVALGEADAGIVYRTDAASAPDTVDAVAIPADLDVVAEYPIAALSRAQPAAQAWIDHVLSPAGQQTLARFGFAPARDPAGSEARPGVP